MIRVSGLPVVEKAKADMAIWLPKYRAAMALPDGHPIKLAWQNFGAMAPSDIQDALLVMPGPPKPRGRPAGHGLVASDSELLEVIEARMAVTGERATTAARAVLQENGAPRNVNIKNRADYLAKQIRHRSGKK